LKQVHLGLVGPFGSCTEKEKARVEASKHGGFRSGSRHAERQVVVIVSPRQTSRFLVLQRNALPASCDSAVLPNGGMRRVAGAEAFVPSLGRSSASHQVGKRERKEDGGDMWTGNLSINLRESSPSV
jgi:hypothetical protein